MKLTSILEEVKGATYDFGCVLLNFNLDLVEIHNCIEKKDLVLKSKEGQKLGIEDEPHVTLLYGLHEEVTVEQIKEVVCRFNFNKCCFYDISCFYNDEYDVLKFEVKGDNLEKVNEELRKLPHTNKYLEYNPHLTLAYLKKGKGKEYINKFNSKILYGEPINIKYSMSNGEKKYISLQK